MQYISKAWWPSTVNLGTPENTSEDIHDTRDAAQWVCKTLERHGLGGNGEIFPIETQVIPVPIPIKYRVLREHGYQNF